MYYAYKKIKEHRRQKPLAQETAQDTNTSTQKTTTPDQQQPVTNDQQPGASDQQPTTNDTFKKSKIKKQLSPEEAADKKRRTIYRWKLIAGLFGPFALQALDTTIIASALSDIATEFHQVKQLNWIISAFNLTSAAFLFFWAQMTDVFGRHVTVQASILTMLIGSAICTAAPTSSFAALLVGRAIQGVGCSGVNISVRTILADRVSLSEYATNWTIFVLINGVSFGLGPLIGGYLTQASWRWCFAINLPIGVVSVVLVAALLRKELIGPQPLPELAGSNAEGGSRGHRFLARISTVDAVGQLLFLLGMGLLLLAFTWGGSTYPWGSAAVVAPLVLGVALTVAWLVFERSMAHGRAMARVFGRQRAMMPWDLLSQRDTLIVFLVGFGGGMAMFAAMYFMDLYFTFVEGKSPSDAGIGLLYYMPGLAVGVYMAIFAAKVWPRQTLPPLAFGALTTAVGISVLAWAVHARNTSVIYGMLALIGQGVMLRMNPASLHYLGYFPDRTSQITCLSAFAIPFGGLVGLTIMTTVFNNKSGVDHLDAKEGITWAFISMIPFMWACVLLALCLGNVWILKNGDHEILHGSYILGLLRRGPLNKELRHRGEGRFRESTLDKSVQPAEDNC
ncbi:Major facilitator superfamily domain, general substrate transporter [Cordyceps fumosorosea ARSEF 2679]|uniref:Major facilitator superfamily domain, general substrate transporter n=1 Tax=Cordyceps fumosorosea (strain ARSEF 2679) TaxID=1081104 RepID=A0A167MR26_CORFA|nr:Major facilitator superfamily domain, general substrate transporter [Cordyceps fumosorosea ARSEF 2679]OAA54661.1 Major facilitator superfamily domain, general substrate transporter [Cordyceps fumosorosea ARSEF 2679]